MTDETRRSSASNVHTGPDHYSKWRRGHSKRQPRHSFSDVPVHRARGRLRVAFMGFESMPSVRAFLHGRHGWSLRPLHAATMRAQVAAIRASDALAHRHRVDDRNWVASNATIAIKTFERPATLRRLIRSARRYFNGRIIVADDSREPQRALGPGVDVIALPFNSGVAIGRNAALAAVDTPYVIVSDDDAIFTKAADWEGALGYLERFPDVDLVGARLIELPTMRYLTYSADPLFPGHAPLKHCPGQQIGGLAVQAMIPQAYAARTAAVRQIGWDENLRMVDHRDFFSRAAGNLVTVASPDLTVLHCRTTFDKHYAAYRDDVATDLAYLARKWAAREAA
jgi:beta-1,4-N-acetylgalactosaminyltransferase 2